MDPGAVFARLTPATLRYASVPIDEAFTWDGCAAELEAGEWYLVAFRSVLRDHADHAVLWEHDRRAHEEARRQPGFIHYFHGTPNERNECLSFCLWESRPHAREAAKGAAHLEAVALVAASYESYVLEFHRVRKRHGATRLEFEPYDRVPAA